MIHERIYLDPTNKSVYLDTYVSQNCNGTPRNAMLVLPGGGYRLCSEREAEPIALAYMAAGFNAFVLNYRVGDGDRYPSQLIDASRAVVYIRENAEKYNINKDRVFAVGFSAGGHLAGSLATLCSDPEVLTALGIKEGDNRPNAVVLGYPVVSAVLETHKGSFERLTGKAFDEITEEEKIKLSLECHVDKNTPPAFIWHTAKDETVKPCGSLRLAEKYVEAGVTVMLKLYPYGCHGLSLGNNITAESSVHFVPSIEDWVDESVKWLKTI